MSGKTTGNAAGLSCDHLPFQGATRGSTSLVTNAGGAAGSEARYLPYGQAYLQWGRRSTSALRVQPGSPLAWERYTDVQNDPV